MARLESSAVGQKSTDLTRRCAATEAGGDVCMLVPTHSLVLGCVVPATEGNICLSDEDEDNFSQ